MKTLRITLEGKTYEVGVEVLDVDACIAIAPLPARLVPDLRRQHSVLYGDFLQVVAFDAAFCPGFHDGLRECAELVRVR